MNYFLRTRSRPGTAVALLVFLSLFLLLVVCTYTRLLLVIIYHPGLIPTEQSAARIQEPRQPKAQGNEPDIEAQRYVSGRDNDPNSPGLERFYSKDVFVCENDGLPRYCSSCRVWKPDRVHHSSEINGCVRKMDHYCPWVGGIISETCRPYHVDTVFTFQVVQLTGSNSFQILRAVCGLYHGILYCVSCCIRALLSGSEGQRSTN